MLSDKKPQIEKHLEPLAKLLSRVNPNILTLLGSIPPLLFFVFVLKGWHLLAVIAFLGTFFDLIDGLVARKYNKVTRFGGFFDSTLDRVSDFLLITAFSFSEIVRWEIAAPLLMFSYLTSYTRAQGELRSENKVSFAVGLIERPERLLLTLLALLLYIFFGNENFAGLNTPEWVFVILVLLSFYTVVQRILHAYKKL